VPKSTTLDDPEGLLCICFKTHASFGAHHENLNEDNPETERQTERLFRHKTKQHNNAISVIATSFVTGHQKRQTAHQCLVTQIKKIKKRQSCTTLKNISDEDVAQLLYILTI